MSWNAHLSIDYALEAGRTVARHTHFGPLRVLKSLYPEGGGVCHNVLIHPPSGLVGGDVLDLHIDLQASAHAVLTTPGATRFYGSTGPLAMQQVCANLGAAARLEWLPLETIAYPKCLGQNTLKFALNAGAQLMAWDVTALGLPLAGQGFFDPDLTATGSFTQHFEVMGHWLERGQMQAHQAAWWKSALGLAGQNCLGSFVLASGSAFSRTQLEVALEAARSCIGQSPLEATSAATAPNGHVVVVRALSAQTEPMMALFKYIRAAWRSTIWGLNSPPLRLWCA